MKKRYTYHKCHSYMNDDKEINCITQQYQTGVYGILNNNSSMQFTTTPSKMNSLERKLKKDLKEGKISNLNFSGKIVVFENDKGLWEELKE